MAKTPKKDAVSRGKNSAPKVNEPKRQAEAGGDRKVNPWIPVGIVAFIIALIAVMAVMGNSSSTTPGDTGTTTTASGTTQSGGTDSGTANTSWITLDTTAAQLSEKTGYPVKMIQQVLGITEADMDKPFSQLGGEETVAKAQSLVQGGTGAMGGSPGGTSSGMGGTSGAPSGMGGTTAP